MGEMQSAPEEMVQGPAPLPASTARRSRHSAVVRATHWIIALSFLALLVSAAEILISHPRFYWGENGNVLTPVLFKLPIPSSRSLVPTGYGYVLPDQNGWSRYLHFQSAGLALVTGLVYVAAGFASGHFHKNLLPRGEDVSWRDRPGMFSLARLKRYPSRNQITQLACEEGWSYVAEWTGVSLSRVLEVAGIQPQAKYVVYFSIDPDWWDSIDMVDALHPLTYLAYGMNGGELSVGNGGPLRMRVPRQLG